MVAIDGRTPRLVRVRCLTAPAANHSVSSGSRRPINSELNEWAYYHRQGQPNPVPRAEILGALLVDGLSLA